MATIRQRGAPALARAAQGWLLRPGVRLAMTATAFAYLALRGYLLVTSHDPLLAADAFTYWSAPYDDPYAGPQLGLPGAYLYPPPFLQALAPVRLLPWELFHGLWTALGLAALVFMVGPVGASLAVTFLSFVFRDLLIGNIHLMLGAALVLGLRHPAVWAFPILTKITPGVGVLWFAARSEWRPLATSLAAATGVAALSYAIAPDLWPAWISRMRGDSGTAGNAYLLVFVGRLVLAAMLVVYAGRRDRPWLIPIAVVISLPIVWPDSLAILIACFPLFAIGVRNRSRVLPFVSDPETARSRTDPKNEA